MDVIERTRDLFKPALIVLAGLALAPHIAHAQISYDFDDGTLQGWTTLLSDPGFQEFLPTEGPPPMWASGPESGTHFVSSLPVANRDLPHDTLLIRSPEFVLNDSGDLTFFLGGGAGSADLPASATDVFATPSTSDLGYMGMALRRASDDEYVLTIRRTGQGEDWQANGFTASELSPFVGETFTLDYVDQKQGSWGWTAIDTISIPGTVPTSVGPPFIRGDVNNDGVFDISDAVFGLAALFIPGAVAPTCLDAGDANDDAVFDISDPVFMLGALFLPGASPLPPPHPDCGADPIDALDCASFGACP